MQFRSVGRAVLVTPAPVLALRMFVETIDTMPRRATVFRAKQSLRRTARIPHARLRRVPGREPERVVEHAPGAFAKRGRLFRFVPCPSTIGRAKNRGPQMAGARRREQDLAVARIDDAMVHDVAQELRAGQAPT